MSSEVLNRILDSKIVAIVRGVPSTQIVGLAKALADGGVNCMEVTFDQTSPEKLLDTVLALRNIKAEMGDRICLGAGTVMTVEQVQQAAAEGALFMISPNVDEDVIRETKRMGLVSIPGAMTATEAAFAYKCGADIVKLFPAGVLGSKYLKAMKAPLKHIPMVAVGSVNVENCAEFIKAGAVGIGVGGNLVSPKLVAEGRFDEITETARAYVKALSEV